MMKIFLILSALFGAVALADPSSFVALKFPVGVNQIQYGSDATAFIHAKPDGSALVPRWMVPELVAKGAVITDGTNAAAIDVRAELAKASREELMTYLRHHGVALDFVSVDANGKLIPGPATEDLRAQALAIFDRTK